MAAGQGLNSISPIPDFDENSFEASDELHVGSVGSPYRRFTSRDLTRRLLRSTSITNPPPIVRQRSTVSQCSNSSWSSVTSFSFRAITREQRLILVSLALLDFFAYLCLSLPAPFFPQEAENKGISTMISGWIFGSFSLVQVLASPIFGKLLMHVDSKFMCVGGTFLAGGCTVLFGTLDYMPYDTDSDVLVLIVFCFILRSFLSIGCTAVSTATFAITADTFPDNVGAVFGTLEIFTGLGLMAGPALGGVLYDYLGFMGPFTVLGGLMIASVPLIACVLPKQEAVIHVQGGGVFWALLRVGPASITLVSVVLSAMIWSLLDPTLEPHLRQFDLSTSIVGLIFLLMAAFYAISSPIWGWVADKVPDSSILIMLGFFFSALGLLLLGPSPLIPLLAGYNELWLNLVALVILGISVSLAMIPTFEKVLDAADIAGLEESLSLYSAVAGLWGSANALGEFIGPSLGGIGMEKLGFPMTATVVAFLCIFMGFVILLTFICEKYTKCCVKTPTYSELKDEEGDSLDSLFENSNEPHYVNAADPGRGQVMS